MCNYLVIVITVCDSSLYVCCIRLWHCDAPVQNYFKTNRYINIYLSDIM